MTSFEQVSQDTEQWLALCEKLASPGRLECLKRLLGGGKKTKRKTPDELFNSEIQKYHIIPEELKFSAKLIMSDNTFCMCLTPKNWDSS